jgi:hypothetical protein
MMRKILNIIFILVLFHDTVMSQAENPPLFRVIKMSFNNEMFSEISPVIVKDGIIFCSNRRFSSLRDRTSFDGKRVYNIYIARKKDTADWYKPVEIRTERSYLFNNGPLCFSPDGSKVFFTSDVETGDVVRKKTFRNHSGIFEADYNEAANILSDTRPFPFNGKQHDTGHPSLSSDGKVIYFSSTMPGGRGGSDIWYCTRDGDKWSDPVNPGPAVNSPSNENYPFIHPSGTLYFSSNRPGGRGRLDVYRTAMYLGKWETPVAMPEPVNSPYDDFAFVADTDLLSGYFSSNRDRTDDIYRFVSTIIRKAYCDALAENNYCYELIEENAAKFDTIPFRYVWKFGDGSSAEGAAVVHCYPGAGSYLVQLDVENLITREIMYNEKSYNLEITDIEQPYITSPDTGAVGQVLKLDAGSTNLPGWSITRYYWNFGDETVAVGSQVGKVYARPGTYNIQLIVTDEPQPGGIAREACVCKNIVIIN